MAADKRPDCNCYGSWRPAEECPVFLEMAAYRDANARAAQRAEYLAAAQRRAAQTGMTKPQAAYKLQNLGVPAQTVLGLRDATEGDAIEAARKFVGQPSPLMPFLVLLGDPGVGKSVGAAYVLQDFVMKHRWNDGATGTKLEPFLWVAARDLTSLSQFEKDDRDRLERWRSSTLLVIDDAGDEGSRIGREALAGLLMDRADNRRWTVLTSNVTGDAFRARYGEALADRLRAMAIVPKLRRESFRRRA